jgi:hypothetical protein
MVDIIEDGTGMGYRAKVDKNNRLYTISSVWDNSFYMSLTKKDAYTLSISNITAAVANNCIGYIKNTSTDKDMIIVHFRHRCETTNTALSIKIKDTGTPANTTIITPVNRNATSTLIATGDFYSGTGITGLSGGSTVGSIYSVASQPFEDWEPCSCIILGTNNTMTFYVDNNTAANWIGIGFYFREV